jgi:hypothetical protein
MPLAPISIDQIPYLRLGIEAAREAKHPVRQVLPPIAGHGFQRRPSLGNPQFPGIGVPCDALKGRDLKARLRLEALRKHRNGGVKQTVTVQHVNVEDGGQAIVSNVQAGGRGWDEK